jgi:hypothetical protein
VNQNRKLTTLNQKGESTMNECERLFRADHISAFFSSAQRALVISAQVTINPFSDHVQICRNPLEPPAPAVHEYMVLGRTRPGIHPDLVVNLTISASFSMDATPAKLAVYSMGIDAPEVAEIAVTDEPSPPVVPAVTTPVEATGWSKEFILQEAFTNALTELRAAAGY